MNHFLFVFFAFLGCSGLIFGHDLNIEMVMPLENDQAITLMDDGSVWKVRVSGYPSVFAGNTIPVENYNDPKVGNNYPWAFGYYAGFDENWTVIHKSALLLLREQTLPKNLIPYDAYKEYLIITQIVHFDNIELITLDNGAFLIMPPQHAGNAVGDTLLLQVLSNGTTAYLTRKLDDEGASAQIAMRRNSDISFVAH